MSWDERIFSSIYRAFAKGFKKTEPRQGAFYFFWQPARVRLELLMQALLGRVVNLVPAEVEEIPNLTVLPLPKQYAPYGDSLSNQRALLARILAYVTAVKNKYYFDKNSAEDRDFAMSQTLLRRREICIDMKVSFSGLEWLPNFLDSLAEDESKWIEVFGFLPTNKEQKNQMEPILSLLEKKKDLEEKSEGDALVVRSRVLPKLRQLKEKEENPLVHMFEKVLTAEEYQGGNKAMDAEDQIQSHKEALEELVLGDVIRSEHDGGGYVKSNAWIESEVLDVPNMVGVTGAPVQLAVEKEWFVSTRSYREGWCTVYEESYNLGNEDGSFDVSGSIGAKSKNRARQRIESLNNLELWRGRQSVGPDFDLNAVVDAVVNQKLGHSVDERLYVNRKKLDKDFAILILLDTSMSTDSWACNRRILDDLKCAVAALGHSLADYQKNFAIGGFYSKTRNFCYFGWIKKYSESWSLAQRRMTSVKPKGHTRMGAAIRYGVGQLMEKKARKRALFLVTDGRPSDLDRYEGRHGNADVSKALQEARALGVYSRIFATSNSRLSELYRIFDSNSVHVISGESELVDGIVHSFSEFIR